MKKLIISFLALIPSSGYAAVATMATAITPPHTPITFGLPTICDRQYADDIKKTLFQLSGFNRPDVLKSYEDYMIMTKAFEDFNFAIHDFESTVSTPTLAFLRTPAQKYNVCRNSRITVRGISSTDCDASYGLYMLKVLKQLEAYSTPDQLQAYKDHMLRVKHLEDTRFKIQRFEHAKINLPMIGTLRAPVLRYMNCRDTIFRTVSQ